MIILLGEWRNIGTSKVQVLSINLCYCARTCAELQRTTLRELCLFQVEAFCSNVDLQMQAATKCQEAHFHNLFVLSDHVSVGTRF